MLSWRRTDKQMTTACDKTWQITRGGLSCLSKRPWVEGSLHSLILLMKTFSHLGSPHATHVARMLPLVHVSRSLVCFTFVSFAPWNARWNQLGKKGLRKSHDTSVACWESALPFLVPAFCIHLHTIIHSQIDYQWSEGNGIQCCWALPQFLRSSKSCYRFPSFLSPKLWELPGVGSKNWSTWSRNSKRKRRAQQEQSGSAGKLETSWNC